MDRASLPTGTVTFLFSDIEGSTRLVQQLGPATYRDVLEQHHRLLRDAFGRHGGIERGTQGDSFLVIFVDAVAGASAAIDGQRALLGADWPVAEPVRVRMGLHTGSPELGGDDYIGIDIHRAARIAAAAHGGQILVSAATAVLAEGMLPPGVSLRDLGTHRLKDLARPERLLQIEVAGLPSRFPPPATLEAADGNVPARLTTFVGRDRDLDAIEALLTEVRLVTLTGPGGSGKTSLATELARRVRGRYPGGAWFVPLGAVEDPDHVPAAVASALRVVEDAAAPDIQQIVQRLEREPALLVLDNFEQVLDAGRFVAELMLGAPDLRIVVTSRAPLRVSGEQEYPVAPLSLPLDAPTVETALGSDCIRLFLDRARRVRPDFAVSGANVSSLVSICERVDGLPLGIELAAARVGLLDAASIAERLGTRLDLPGTRARDLPARQQSLEGAIRWSYDLLGEAARTLLGRMGVFAGGARLTEIEMVAAALPEDADVLEALSELVEHSLVQPVAGADGPRYRLLETIRRFAVDRLAEQPDGADVRRRHALAYLAFAQAAAAHLPGRDQASWLTLLDAEHGNFRAAVRWALDNDTRTALELCGALWRFWQMRGHVREGLDLVREALALPGADAPTEARMHALDAFGSLNYWSGQRDAALDLYKEQRDLAMQLGNERGIAVATWNLAHASVVLDKYEAGADLIEEAIRRFEDLGDELFASRAAWGRGVIAQARQQEVAMRHFEAALDDSLRLGDTPYIALGEGSLSWVALASGDVAGGIEWGVRSLQRYHALGDIGTTTITLHGSAILLGALGRPVESATTFGAYDALAARHGVRPPSGLAQLLVSFGSLDAVVEALGREEFDRLAAIGARMSLDEAVDYVVRATEASMPSDAPPARSITDRRNPTSPSA